MSKQITGRDLKVGMRVRRYPIVDGNYYAFDGTVDNLTSDGKNCSFRDVKPLLYYAGTAPTGHTLSSVNIFAENCVFELIEEQTNDKHAMTFNFIDALKRMTLSATDKALMTAGLEDPTGVPTADGLRAMQLKQWSDCREDMGKLAVELIAADKAEKKA